MKSGLARITEGTSQYQGVVVFSMNDLPLVCKILIFQCIVNYLFLQYAKKKKKIRECNAKVVFSI